MTDRYSYGRAATYLGLARQTVANLVYRKAIRREPDRPVILRSELDRYLAERGEKPADPTA